MTLPIDGAYFDDHKDTYEPVLIETVMRECPEETLCRYPFTLLVLGYQAFASGQIAVYRRIGRPIGLSLQKEAGFELETRREITGEILFFATMEDFNDMSQLGKAKKPPGLCWASLPKSSRATRPGVI